MIIVGILDPHQEVGAVRWVLSRQTTEGLPIGLGVVSRSQADPGAKGRAEGLPDLGHKLGSPVGNNVLGNAIMSEHFRNQDVGHFSGGGKLGQRNKLGCFRKPVDNGEDNGVTLGRRPLKLASEEIESSVDTSEARDAGGVSPDQDIGTERGGYI